MHLSVLPAWLGAAGAIATALIVYLSFKYQKERDLPTFTIDKWDYDILKIFVNNNSPFNYKIFKIKSETHYFSIQTGLTSAQAPTFSVEKNKKCDLNFHIEPYKENQFLFLKIIKGNRYINLNVYIKNVSNNKTTKLNLKEYIGG